jgi:NADH-ubiquinone oxidoreductase chain 4
MVLQGKYIINNLMLTSMILFTLLLVPLIGVFILLCKPFINKYSNIYEYIYNDKATALFITSCNFLVSLSLIFFFDFSSNQFQFVVESINIHEYNFYLGVDGISIYFVLLTTIIMPIAILSN